ncbi:unnamed protein product [Closterium sp. NIES-53]
MPTSSISAGGDAPGGGKEYPRTASSYRLLEEIGHGISAVVFKAMCIPFKEIVAIKRLDLEQCNSSLEDIRREAQTMTMIGHPNLVRAHCSFVGEQYLWVVMPFMDGGSCLHIMKSCHMDGLDEPIIATVLRETLKGLDYLHRNGHIHRDVKAGNILIDAVGNVRLADFGVSACMFDTGDRLLSRKTFVGTPCWMAPEVLEQLHGYDYKADIWSLGITALELAHGHAPFSKYPPMKSQFAHVLKLQTTTPFDGKDFFTWSFEFELMMEGAQILGIFDGRTNTCVSNNTTFSSSRDNIGSSRNNIDSSRDNIGSSRDIIDNSRNNNSSTNNDTSPR